MTAWLTSYYILSVIPLWKEYYFSGKYFFSFHPKGVWSVILRGVLISVFNHLVSCFCSEVDPTSVVTCDSHSFSATLTYLHKLDFFRWGEVVRETMGSRKTSGSEDLSPFTHTSPEEPAVPHVITADNSGRWGWGWGSSVSALQGKFVIPPSLKNDRSLLF